MKFLTLAVLLLTLSCHNHDEDAPAAPAENSPLPAPTPAVKAEEPKSAPEGTVKPRLFEPEAGVLSKAGAFAASIRWISGPVQADYSEFQLTIADGEFHASQSLVAISVKPWMTLGSMSHGTGAVQPIVHAKPDSSSTFLVNNLCFTMAGVWDLYVHATVNGIEDEADVKVTVPE